MSPKEPGIAGANYSLSCEAKAEPRSGHAERHPAEEGCSSTATLGRVLRPV